MDNYPNEACAFIINGKLVPVKNISPKPHEEFQLSTEDSLLYIKAQGFIHSHPDGPYHPSAADMTSQKSCGIPFGIITCGVDSTSSSIWITDDTLSLILENRPFVHGISDCYSLIRAYYWQSRHIKLQDFPRDMDWWEPNASQPAQNLYLDNFEKAGFIEINSMDEMQEGDVILMTINTVIPSHAAIYIGEGLILHHLRDRISRKDHAAVWKKFFHTILRYNG